MVELKITLPGQAESDHSDLLTSEGYSYTQDGFGQELASVRNSCTVNILYDSVLINNILNATDYIHARILDNGVLVFQGIVAPISSLKIARQSVDLQLTINDLNDLLDIPSPSVWITNGYLSYKPVTSVSVIHQLLAGVTVIDKTQLPNLNSGTTMETKVEIKAYASDPGKTIYDNLRDILSNNGYYHYFEGNKIYIACFARSTGTLDYVITDQNTINDSVNISVSDKTETEDSVRVKYKKIIKETDKICASADSATPENQNYAENAGEVGWSEGFKSDLLNSYKSASITTLAQVATAWNNFNSTRYTSLMSGAYKPTVGGRYIKYGLLGAPIVHQLAWDALPSNSTVLSYTLKKGTYTLGVASPSKNGSVNPTDKMNYGTQDFSTSINGWAELVNVSVNRGMFYGLVRIKEGEKLDFYKVPTRTQFWDDTLQVQYSAFYLQRYAFYFDLIIKVDGGVIDLPGTKLKYKEINLENCFSEESARAYANFYKDIVLGGGSTLEFSSYNNYEINKIINYISDVGGQGFTGLIGKKSYEQKTGKYNYSVVLTAPITIEDQIEYSDKSESLPDSNQILQEYFNSDGSIVKPIDSTQMQAVPADPGKSGVYLGSNKFGFYDNDTQEWTVEITDLGNAKFKGEVQADTGLIGGWTIDPLTLKSATTGKRIELEPVKNRVEVWADSGTEPKTAMGYLGGLSDPSNRTLQLDSNVFGFWSAEGEKITLNGDIVLSGEQVDLKSDSIMRWGDTGDWSMLAGLYGGSANLRFKTAIAQDAIIKTVNNMLSLESKTALTGGFTGVNIGGTDGLDIGLDQATGIFQIKRTSTGEKLVYWENNEMKSSQTINATMADFAQKVTVGALISGKMPLVIWANDATSQQVQGRNTGLFWDTASSTLVAPKIAKGTTSAWTEITPSTTGKVTASNTGAQVIASGALVEVTVPALSKVGETGFISYKVSHSAGTSSTFRLKSPSTGEHNFFIAYGQSTSSPSFFNNRSTTAINMVSSTGVSITTTFTGYYTRTA